MNPEEAEKWIVNLIRNARLDAKIDSKLVSSSTCIHLHFSKLKIDLDVKNFKCA